MTDDIAIVDWEIRFDERMHAEGWPELYKDGQSPDHDRESAYRAGWLEALQKAEAEPDFIFEDVELAEDDRAAIKLSIMQRYADGETIGRDDQLAVDKARGSHHLLVFLVDEAKRTYDRTLSKDERLKWLEALSDDQWSKRINSTIRKWSHKTELWINKGYRQPDMYDDSTEKQPTIEQCIANAPQFVREYIEHHAKTAYRQQPRFALAGALALVGVLCGRRVRDSQDARTNVYNICVGPPSCGKDHSRKLNTRLLVEAEAGDLLGADEATSDSAIGRMLAEHPATLMQIDEMGRWLAGADALKNVALHKVVTMIQKLWSDVTSTRFQPLAYADRTKNYSIDQPNLCILGTTTPENFYASLGGDSIDDGLLSRVNIFVGDGKAKRRKPKLIDPPSEMVAFVRRWFEYLPEGELADLHPRPTIIPTDDEAEELYDSFADRCDELAQKLPAVASLWGRCLQKARQFGLIYAIASESEIIDGWSAQWGIDLAEALTTELCQIAETRLHRSPFDRDCQEILRAIREAKNGVITKKELCRAVRRLKAREQRECVNALIDQERIGCGSIAKEGGRPTTVYFCADRNPEMYDAWLDAKNKSKGT